MKYITAEEAIVAVKEKALSMAESNEQLQQYMTLGKLAMFAERYVMDVLDYCHRVDFPYALIYVGAELAVKYFADSSRDAPGPLKSLKENDVQFEWAVSSVSPIGCISEQDFESIRNKLNLYRKVVHHG